MLLAVTLSAAGCAIPIAQTDPNLPFMGSRYAALVQITSTPSGANVYLNGAYMGQTPTAVRCTLYQTLWEANSGLLGKFYSYDRVLVEKEGYSKQGEEVNSETVQLETEGMFMRVKGMKMHFVLNPETQ